MTNILAQQNDTLAVDSRLIEDCVKIATWAQTIGLDVREVTVTCFPNSDIKPFFSNIWIDCGIVYYNQKTHPGDLLHELGHLAVTPSWLRPYVSGDIEDWDDSQEICILAEQHKDDPCFGCYGDEVAAIVWSYVAAQAAGVDDFLPFEQGFEIDGDDAGEKLHESLTMSEISQYAYHDGIYHLVHFGMLQNEQDFPKLCKWILD
jgi:hypothetical protein